MTMHYRLPRREAPPRLWSFFCVEFFGLSRQQTEQWWHALQRARWSRPVELRSVFLCRVALGPQQGTMRHFVTQNLSPAVLIDALEDFNQGTVAIPSHGTADRTGGPGQDARERVVGIE